LGTVDLGVKIPQVDLLVTVSPALRTDHKGSKDYKSNEVGLGPGLFSGAAAAGASMGALPTATGSGRAPLLALSAGTGCAPAVSQQAQHEREAVRKGF